ncbi:unnamed protein product [Paramecium primaurelia]|uniref:Protein kinase domain-containing protein n=1 Tax=Paramecium primaurelia TaxID=5886 RepID=A0A8S1L233_PARPR|nr:unnamed protein product [Paramecium primaurelia]
MNQQFAHFNLEKLDETYREFILRYSCEEYDEFTCVRNNNELQYCARKYKLGSINNPRFQALRRIKLYNILPVFDIFLDSQTIVAQDVEKFSLENNMEDLTEEQKIYLATIISITLQELAYRGFPFIITERSVIILENHICLQSLDFNFDREVIEQESFDSFKKLMIKLFGDFLEINFENSTNYFLMLNNVYLGPSENMPYVELLDQIFEFTNVATLASAASNSYVYEFDTPEFMKTIPNISQRTVLKSVKLDLNDTNQDYILTSSQRELEIMENFKKYEPLVACYAYFRIQKQLYIFMERYPQVLSNMLEGIDEDRHCIQICWQLAVALKYLHQHQIIHRDLKPGNLFLSHENLDRARLLIADFDRSRLSQWLTQSITQQKESEQKQQDQIGKLNELTPKSVLGATPCYDPPEAGTTDYDQSADIWQVGMIMFQIANKGEYPIQMIGQNFSRQQYQSNFTKEQIKKQLSQYNVNEQFIDIIAKCLSFNRKDRPTSCQLVNELQICFEEINPDTEENLISSHNLSQIGRYGQLISSTRTLKMLNSQDL